MKHIALLLAALLFFFPDRVRRFRGRRHGSGHRQGGSLRGHPAGGRPGRPDPCLFGRGEHPGAGGRRVHRHGIRWARCSSTDKRVSRFLLLKQ